MCKLLWERDAIIMLAHEFEAMYGRPPTATDWNPTDAQRRGRTDLLNRFYADGCWPYMSTVVLRFGSWNAMIEAAGFTPKKGRPTRK